MAYKDNDFVKIDFDIYANDQLVNTTDEKKGKEANLQIKEYGPQTIILGKAFILKALDEDLKKNDKNTLNLKANEAYGKRQKELIKTFPKSAFDEQKLRPVVGITYDFNGMFGTVKSVIGGRVMVDFNNPLSGKDIKLDYKVVEKVEDISQKVALVLESILRIPKTMFKVTSKEKTVTLEVPGELVNMKEMLEKSLKEIIPEFKDFKLELKPMTKKANK